MRGEVICSSRLGPMRHRSPIRASLTSMPRVVRFSPKKPFGSSRPNRSAQRSRSSRWKAYTAWSLPPWCLPSPMKSPTSPLPNPDRFGPGSRTWTGPSTGCLPIPVDFTSLCGLGRGRPMLTESRMGTGSDYVAGARDASGNSIRLMIDHARILCGGCECLWSPYEGGRGARYRRRRVLAWSYIPVRQANPTETS